MVHTLDGSSRSETSNDALAVRSPSFKGTPVSKKRTGEAGAGGSAKKASPYGVRKTELKKVKSFTEKEPLSVILNVYDLVWDRDSEGGRNAGLADLGLGFYHTGRIRPVRPLALTAMAGLEIWGKEISFGHSRRYRSGVFAVKPKKAQEYMPNTRYKMSIEMDSIVMSRLRFPSISSSSLPRPILATSSTSPSFLLSFSFPSPPPLFLFSSSHRFQHGQASLQAGYEVHRGQLRRREEQLQSLHRRSVHGDMWQVHPRVGQPPCEDGSFGPRCPPCSPQGHELAGQHLQDRVRIGTNARRRCGDDKSGGRGREEEERTRTRTRIENVYQEKERSIDLEREISKIAEVPVNAENISSNPSQPKAFDTSSSSSCSSSSSSEQSMKSWISSQVPDTSVMMEEKENNIKVIICCPCCAQVGHNFSLQDNAMSTPHRRQVTCGAASTSTTSEEEQEGSTSPPPPSL